MHIANMSSTGGYYMTVKINFDEQHQIFHLTNQKISYILGIEEGQLLAQLYFGKKITSYHNSRRYPRLDRGFSPNLAGKPAEIDRRFSKDVLPQEYSGNQTGDYRQTAINLTDDVNGASAADFRYADFKIVSGKPHLKGLPQTYIEKGDEAQTLIIHLIDATLRTSLYLSYTIYDQRAVIIKSAKLVNNSDRIIRIDKIASAQLDLPKNNFDLISLYGAHVNERQIQKNELPFGITEISSRRGSSSHHFNPFIALVDKHISETSGEAIGVQLVYSGNHQFTIEKDYIQQLRIITGINEYGFNWQLAPTAEFQTPEAIFAYTDKGLNDLSLTYHKLLRERVARGKFKYAKRPIVINNWEATYFDFNATKIKAIIDKAAPLGIEMFVLDDGWFGKRDDDKSSLGDWYEYVDKLSDGGGLANLAEMVHKKNMQFGLWFEPEMISADSKLYRQHPDYALTIDNREMTPSRDQYVLDFSRDEVVDNIFNQICQILDTVKIDYIKWDMNRHLTEVYSHALNNTQQGEVYHRYMLGVYDLAERLVTKYPDILFEGCSGGGGRFDAGMLYYFPQSWTSDNTDPIARLKIQYGTSLAYPLSSMTAHVSASPNHQTGRQTSLAMRAGVAFAGVLGYELDLSKLTDDELKIIAMQIAFYQKHWQLLQYGDFKRIKSPFEENEVAWEFVSANQEEVMLFNYRILSEAQPSFSITKLTGLKDNYLYQETTTHHQYYGDELMNVGLYDAPVAKQDFTVTIKHFKKIK